MTDQPTPNDDVEAHASRVRLGSPEQAPADVEAHAGRYKFAVAESPAEKPTGANADDQDDVEGHATCRIK